MTNLGGRYFSSGERASRHLNRAAVNANKSWIPCNPRILKEICDKFSAQSYTSKPDNLVNDIKKDLGVFTYCVKRLAELVTQDAENSYAIDPLRTISEASLGTIKTILVDNKADIATFSLGNCNTVQAANTKRTMVSATVAEAISHNHEIDSDLAFATAVFRQLGLTLVAWNYPAIFQNNCSQNLGQDIDQALDKVLGFSPSMLGLTFARKWHITPSILAAMGDPNAVEDPAVSSVSITLDKLCKIGEVFASCLDSDYRASNSTSWEFACSEIESSLGSNGLKIIRERLEETCTAYIKYMPQLFSFDEFPPSPTSTTKRSHVAYTLNNRHLRHCPATVQSDLENFYKRLENRQLSRNNIQILAKMIIPSAGFERGCIFLVDPACWTLNPRLPIGKSELSDFKANRVHNYTEVFNPITTAYANKTPIMEEDVDAKGGRIIYIAGVLGETQRMGVLYLEASKELLQQELTNPMLLYKALRDAINDCLNLF